MFKIIAEMYLRIYRDETGLATVEYAVAGALITGLAVNSFTSLGNSIQFQITYLQQVILAITGP